MNKTLEVIRDAARILSLALGEGGADRSPEEGVAVVGTVIPVVIPDGNSPPASLTSGYSWANISKA